MTGFYFPGFAYDQFIGRLLKNIRIRLADLVHEYHLFPILDICCGTGVQCRLLDSGGRQLIAGIDINYKSLNYGRSRAPGVCFICADAERLPFHDDAFSCITISYALHDKDSDERQKILKEISRVLTSEGKVLLLDFENPWDNKSRSGFLFTTLIERTAGNTHFRNGRQFLGSGGLSALIADSNFRELKHWEFPWGHSKLVLAEKTARSITWD